MSVTACTLPNPSNSLCWLATVRSEWQVPGGVEPVQGPGSGRRGHPPGPAGVGPLLVAAWGSLHT